MADKPRELSSLTFEEYAEEYLRQQTRIRRASDFLRGLVVRPPALFEGLMPQRTITMISAEPGCGKTMTAISMCLALDQAGSLMGRFAAKEKQRCFFLGQDAPDWDYAEQFRKLARGIVITEEVEVDCLTNQGGSFTDTRFLAELEQWHNQVGYSVIVFDTLASFHELDENDTRQMGAVMAILKRIRDRFACSVIFTHHTRKPSEVPVSGNYAARGSTVISGSIDFHLAMRRVGSDKVAMSLAKGRGSEKLPIGCGFQLLEYDNASGEPVVKLQFVEGPIGNQHLTSENVPGVSTEGIVPVPPTAGSEAEVGSSGVGDHLAHHDGSPAQGLQPQQHRVADGDSRISPS